MFSTNLQTLKIHKLTQEQYERELNAGRIDSNALYLTEDKEQDLSHLATKQDLEDKSDKGHTHTIAEINELNNTLNTKSNKGHTHNISEINELNDTLNTKSDKGHTHNATEVGADSAGSANKALSDAKAYTDSTLINKANKNHNHDSLYDAKNSASNALSSAKTYTDGKVANLISSADADIKINTHNVSGSAHNDIRTSLSNLTTRLNTLADSDDTTLDQLSEIVTYIKSNKSLIDSVTTSKVSVSDIINNLTTNVSNKPLSAAQGVTLKGLVDNLTTNKANVSHAHAIADITNLQSMLNAKQPLESTTFTIHPSYVAVRTPNRTANQYYEFWDDVGWANIAAGQFTSYSGGFVGDLTGNATSATTASSLSNMGTLTTSESVNNFITGNRLQYALFQLQSDIGVGFASHDGMLLSIPWNSTKYGAQIAIDDNTLNPKIAIRGKNTSWGNWKILPFSDGTNASGTWGINITGSAAKCNGTTLEYAGAISLSDAGSIAAWTNDGTKIKCLDKNVFALAGHSHTYLPTYDIKEAYLYDGFWNSFRTSVKGSSSNGTFISVLRSNSTISGYITAYSSGFAWGKDDTQGFISVSYDGQVAYIGGGNADKLNWVKQISFTDHTHSYLPLSGGTMTGNIRVPGNVGIIQNQNSTSNYTSPILWYKGGTSQATYDPQIGQHNTGGDGNGSICILPYATTSEPWQGSVGLYITKGSMKLDGKEVITANNIGSQSVNYASSAGSANYANSAGSTNYANSAGSASYATYDHNGNTIASHYATKAELNGKANSSHSHTTLTGVYTGNGSGAQPPSYVGTYALKCNMMDQFLGTGVGFSNYADVLMMNAYAWADVPYATALAIQKTNGVPKAWIAAGGNTDKWAGATELITGNNIGSQSVNYANSAGYASSANYTNYINAINLPASANLNSYETPGFYYSPANATVATFSNCPTSNAFFMIVGKHAGIYQEVTEYMTSSYKKYVRNYYNGSWGSWRQISFTDHTHSYLPLSGGTLTGSLTGTTVYMSNWFRSKGATGWYSEDYGGGWYMSDSSWIRTYGSKNIYQDSGIMRTDGTLQVGADGAYFNANSSLVKTGIPLHVNVTNAVDMSNDSAAFVIGIKGSQHMEFDDSRIQAKNNTRDNRTLLLNPFGGNVAINYNKGTKTGGYVQIRADDAGTGYIASNSNLTFKASEFSDTLPGSITFRSAGYWTSSSNWLNGHILFQDSKKHTWLYLAYDTTKPYISSDAIGGRTTSGGSAIHLTSGNVLAKLSSATKYKLDIQNIEDSSYAYNILKLNPKTWYDKAEMDSYANALTGELEGKDPNEVYAGFNNVSLERIPGLIAEDVEAAGLDKYCIYEIDAKNNKKEIDGISYEKIGTLLIPIVRDLTLFAQKVAPHIDISGMDDITRNELAILLNRINSFKESEVIK